MTETTTIPERYRKARAHVVDDAVSGEWAGEMGRWLFEHRDRLVRTANDHWDAWTIGALDEHVPDLAASLRATLFRLLPDAFAPCGVDPFDPNAVGIFGTLMHHGQFSNWHSEENEDGLLFSITLCAGTRMFSGGDLEMLDGTVIEPQSGRLVWLHPAQMCRIREVECWSAHVLHGRWSIGGWVKPKRGTYGH